MLVESFSGVVNQAGTEFTITDGTGVYNASSNLGGNGTPNKATTDNFITELQITKPDGDIVTLQFNRVFTGLITAVIAATAQAPIPYSALTAVLSLAQLEEAESTFPDGVYNIRLRNFYVIAGAGTSGQGYVVINSTLGLTGNAGGGSGAAFDSAATGFADASLIRIYKKAGATVVYEDRTIDTVASATALTVETAWTLANFPDTTSVYALAGYEDNFAISVVNGFMTCYQPKIAKISVQETTCCQTCKSTDIDNLINMMMGIFVIEAQMASTLYTMAASNITALNNICDAEDCNCADC